MLDVVHELALYGIPDYPPASDQTRSQRDQVAATIREVASAVWLHGGVIVGHPVTLARLSRALRTIGTPGTESIRAATGAPVLAAPDVPHGVLSIRARTP